MIIPNRYLKKSENKLYLLYKTGQKASWKFVGLIECNIEKRDNPILNRMYGYNIIYNNIVQGNIKDVVLDNLKNKKKKNTNISLKLLM